MFGMYLRPRQLFDKFLVYERQDRVDEFGRVTADFVAGGIIFGAVTSLNPSETEKFHALKHNVTEKIVKRWGSAQVRVGDKLVRGDEVFLVQAVNDVSWLNQFTIYFVERRGDLR